MRGMGPGTRRFLLLFLAIFRTQSGLQSSNVPPHAKQPPPVDSPYQIGLVRDSQCGKSKVVTFPLSIATHSGLQVHHQVSRGQTDGTSVFSMLNRSSMRFPVLADCSGAISKVVTVPFCDILN